MGLVAGLEVGVGRRPLLPTVVLLLNNLCEVDRQGLTRVLPTQTVLLMVDHRLR